MVKFLGLIDLLAGLVLFSIMGGVIHASFFAVFIIILILKASISFFDIGGAVDIVVALLIFLSLFIFVPHVILLIGMALIGIKGLVSIAS